MITITPQGSVYLCKTPLEKDYKHQLTFANATSQQTYFAGKVQYTCTDFTYMKKDNQIVVDYPIDQINSCNYLFYKNTGFTNKYYYCFITNMEYVNENATRITFETDVWQTYQLELEYKDSFVEREHVNDDTFGLHTVPEGLDTGEFIINSAGEVSQKMRAGYIVIGINKIMDEIPADSFGKTYGNVPSGLVYIIVPNAGQLGAFLRAYDNLGQGTAIQTIFSIPIGFYTPPNNTWPTFKITGTGYGDVTIQGVILSSTTVPYEFETGLEINMNTDLNGYTPVNQKTYTSEFNYLLLSNNAGQEVKYNYEDFIDPPKFNIDAVLCPGCSIKMYPVDYKKYNDIRNTASSGQQETHRPHLQPVEFNYGITAGKYPIGSWSNDAYTNWLTQQAVNEEYNDAKQILGFMWKSAEDVSTVGDIISQPVVNDVINKMQTKKMHEFAPNQTSGNINAGDVAYSSQGLTFMYSKMSVRSEYAIKIDNFFSHFGYRVNEFKIPNVTGRTYWNYVKTIECNIEADIPQEHLQQIKDMFNKGVTFWHDPSKFLDYSQSNTIVTP